MRVRLTGPDEMHVIFVQKASPSFLVRMHIDPQLSPDNTSMSPKDPNIPEVNFCGVVFVRFLYQGRSQNDIGDIFTNHIHI